MQFSISSATDGFNPLFEQIIFSCLKSLEKTFNGASWNNKNTCSTYLTMKVSSLSSVSSRETQTRNFHFAVKWKEISLKINNHKTRSLISMRQKKINKVLLNLQSEPLSKLVTRERWSLTSSRKFGMWELDLFFKFQQPNNEMRWKKLNKFSCCWFTH